MKFICPKKDLKRLLDNIVSIATKSQQDKPLILLNARVDKQAVQFKVNNPLVRGSGILDKEITVEADGKTCVNANIFSDVVTSMQYSNKSIVEIKFDDYGSLSVNSGDYEYTIGTLSPVVFPYIDDKKPNNIIDIYCEDFRKMIQATAHASNRQYPHMQLCFGNRLMRAVTTDTRQLPVYGIEIDSDIQDKIVVSAEAMAILRRLSNGSAMKFAWSGEEIICKFDNYVFRSRAYNAPFPMWENLISVTSNYPKEAIIDATNFRHIIGAAAMFESYILLVFGRGKLTISTKNENKGAGSWEMDTSYRGLDTELRLNSMMLNEYAKLVKGGELTFKISDPNKPALITWSVNKDFQYVVMPMA